MAGEGVPDRWPVATSHNRTVPSSPPLARVLPSGLNATDKTWPVWPVRGSPAGWPVATSHSRTVPSSLPLARVLPSGLNATDEDQAGVAGEGRADRAGRWPRPTTAPCHPRRRWPAVLPSGLNATREDPAGVAGDVEGPPTGLAGGHVPQTAPCQSSPALARVLPSGLNTTEALWTGLAGEGLAGRVAGGHVPQPHRAIVAAAGQDLAVRAERHRHDPAGLAGEDRDPGTCGSGQHGIARLG